jgi:hypothetical protein
MHTQQQESARLRSDSEAEVRRLRKAFDEAESSKEALREKANTPTMHFCCPLKP